MKPIAWIAPDNPVFKDEDVIDRAIRPKALADYQGQDHVRNQMEIFIQAARKCEMKLWIIC
ncbi:hypothetical protein O9929_11085 [Vibrio lentus]|nr:hypothetical protein [Vibrio lentus]